MREINFLTCFSCSLVSSCLRSQGKFVFLGCRSLVESSRRKFSPAQMPLTPSISSLHVLVSCSPARTVEEGDMVTFFLRDVGLALVAKTCPHRPQAFKRSIMVRRFRRKSALNIYVYIWTRQLHVLQGISVKSFTQKFEDLTLPISSHI